MASKVFADDLPESTLKRGEFLVCPQCGERASATRGDYFWMAKDEPFMCEDCDEPMSLVIEVCHYVTLKGQEVD